MFAGPIGKKMMIDQGYVPATCTLNDKIAGILIYAEITAGRSPCAGCHMDRETCKGHPIDPDYMAKRPVTHAPLP